MYIKTRNGDKNITNKENYSQLIKTSSGDNNSSNSSFKLGPWGIAILVLLVLIILFIIYKKFFAI
jgi:hypothetical protein